ncbi:ABC transporter ATP-binding protein [Francisellaceae bacterium]|nr:ABC transporter ATP-binding protein [Francisellaceae bacterium]
MNDVAISVQNLTKIYPMYGNSKDRFKEALHPLRKNYHTDFYALNDVSFEIKKGECVGIVGDNGAGKSTLLKILTGVLTPTSGSIIVNGKIASLLELGAGFNPQMTGIENIYLNGSLMGCSKREIDEKLEHIIEFSGIGKHIHQPVKGYSSGMFARLAFSVAINVEPDILIVDEALSVGDVTFQSKCFRKFQEFKRQGVTILFVSHAVDLIMKNCSVALLMVSGTVCAQGSCKDVVEKYKRKSIIVKSNELLVESKDLLQNNADLMKTQISLNQSPIVYGDFSAEIIDYGLVDHRGEVSCMLEHDSEYSVCMLVKFSSLVKNPVFAFSIKTFDGLELTGTNSEILGHYFEEFQEGSLVRLNFKQNMVLAPGSYLLSLGCVSFDEDGNVIVLHRVYDVFAFNVSAKQMGGGLAYAVSRLEFHLLSE